MTEGTFRFDALVGANGKLEVSVPCAEGTQVKVVVVPASIDDFSDLVAAASSNVDFWDNAWDDEDWSDA